MGVFAVKLCYFILKSNLKYSPSSSKHYKYFKIRKYKVNLISKNTIYGLVGIKALQSAVITNVFLEKLHLFLKRKLKKTAGVWFRVVPFISITKKPLEIRMGKGKGPVKGWIYPIKKAQIFMELTIPNLILQYKIFRALHSKLPFKIRIVKKIL